MDTNRVITGDCFDVLEGLPTNSVHAIVTDPPYGLAFMGRSWDDFSPTEYQEWCEEWATLAMDVLKPGGHLLSFSSKRTHHRLFSGIEDAGFVIRDTLTFHYGNGAPKGLDVSKQLESNGAAERWDGWKTGLKPATEFVALGRNPLSEDTVVENVLKHETGALNIGESRINITDGGGDGNWGSATDTHDGSVFNEETSGFSGGVESEMADGGRYPSNLLLDELSAVRLDRQVGELSSGKLTPEHTKNADVSPGKNCYGEFSKREIHTATYGDTGGPSRFFYTSKATKAERTLGGRIDNAHPTVKPIDLMEWLVRLVTREGQVVLDPFSGTGTTLKAAKNLGREFVGIEQDERWADVARVRAGLTPRNPSHVRSDDDQRGIEAYTDGGC